MSFSGFQFGFAAGFQVVYSNAVPPLVPNGGRPYQPTSHELRTLERLNAIEKAKAQGKLAAEALKAKELQIEDLELRRLREGLSDQKLQAELMQLMMERVQAQMLAMEMQRLLKELLLDDEAILVILLSNPFI